MFILRSILAPFRPRPLTAYERAVRDLAQGRDAQALERLETLIAGEALSGRQRAEAENKRGVALVHLNRRDEARAAFEVALQATPRYAPALVNLGNLQQEAGDFESAIRFYESAAASDETYAPAHHNLGVALADEERFNEAMEQYQAALRIEPNAANLETDYGNALARSGRIPEAIAHYQAALRLLPDSPIIHNDLVNAFSATAASLPQASLLPGQARKRPSIAMAESG